MNTMQVPESAGGHSQRNCTATTLCVASRDCMCMVTCFVGAVYRVNVKVPSSEYDDYQVEGINKVKLKSNPA